MANVAFQNSQGNNGTITLTLPATPSVTWNLSSLSISQAGPTVGPNGKVTIYDGSVASGTVVFAQFLGAPGKGYGGSLALGGSVGFTEEIPLPMTPDGKARSLQATPGNALTIQVTGTGQNQVSINARASDGLPT